MRTIIAAAVLAVCAFGQMQPASKSGGTTVTYCNGTTVTTNCVPKLDSSGNLNVGSPVPVPGGAPAGTINTKGVYVDGVSVGGSAVTDATISVSAVTTNDVSTSKHGWTPMLPNDATKYLNGLGAWAVPASGGGADANGYYLVSRSTSAPTNAVNLGALTTGLTKHSISAGVATMSTAALADITALTGTGSTAITNFSLGALAGAAYPSAGIVKSSGSAFSAAAAGTDYMRPGQVYDNLTTVNAAASPYSVAATDSYILCDATAGVVTITLPAATGTGREITVKKTDASANACTPTRAGSDTIDGAITYSITAQYASSKIVDAASGAWHRSHVNQLGGDLSGISTAATVGSIGGNAISLANTLTTAGNFGLTLTTTAATNITLPTTGTLAVLGGNTFTGTQTAPGITAYDPTATTGTTRSKIRAGAGDSGINSKLFQVFANDGTTSRFSVAEDGTLVTATGIQLGGNGCQLNSAFHTPYYTIVGARNNSSDCQFGTAYSFAFFPTNVSTTPDTGISRISAGVIAAGNGVASDTSGTFRGAYQSSDGTAGVTGATCTAWKNGLCVAN